MSLGLLTSCSQKGRKESTHQLACWEPQGEKGKGEEEGVWSLSFLFLFSSLHSLPRCPLFVGVKLSGKIHEETGAFYNSKLILHFQHYCVGKGREGRGREGKGSFGVLKD